MWSHRTIILSYRVLSVNGRDIELYSLHLQIAALIRRIESEALRHTLLYEVVMMAKMESVYAPKRVMLRRVTDSTNMIQESETLAQVKICHCRQQTYTSWYCTVSHLSCILNSKDLQPEQLEI